MSNLETANERLERLVGTLSEENGDLLAKVNESGHQLHLSLQVTWVTDYVLDFGHAV